jgi:hypothetical protein
MLKNRTNAISCDYLLSRDELATPPSAPEYCGLPDAGFAARPWPRFAASAAQLRDQYGFYASGCLPEAARFRTQSGFGERGPVPCIFQVEHVSVIGSSTSW